jgi:cell division control protein 6
MEYLAEIEKVEKDLFDKFLEHGQIFANKEVLRSSYTPESLPHRGAQVNHMASILVDALKDKTPSNIFIYGKTGTGKTAVVNYIGNELRKTGDGLSKSVNYIYINCDIVDTSYRVLTHIANTIISDWDSRLPITGLPTDEVYNTLREQMESRGGVTTIVLDEIDKLFYKSGDGVLYTLLTMASTLQKSKSHIIGISNDLKFREFLDPRVKSRLGEEEIIFEPYNATQLQDILSERAKIAFNENALDANVIPLCAAIAAQENGDARMALDLLRESAELAEREGQRAVTEKHVRKAQSKIERDRISEVIHTLPMQTKLVLLSVVMDEESKENGVDITTGEVYTRYSFLSKQVDAAPLTQRRITELISELDMLGIINARVVSFGRGGRTRIIQLNVSIPDIKAVMERDDMIKPLLEYKPAKQARLI